MFASTSKVALFFLTFGTLSSLASPTPFIEKRADISNVLSVVNTLKSATDGILPQITSLVSNNSATESNVSPLLAELTSALGTATSSLGSIGTVDPTTGGTSQDVANIIGGVVSDVATTIGSLQTAVPSLVSVVNDAALDAALSQVLLGLETVLAGVLKLVAALLNDVAALLRSLAFSLTLAALGL